MNTNPNRSNALKQRHLFAREQYNAFQEKFPDKAKNTKYSDFLKDKTPLEKEIVAYEVSYQVSYRGTVDEITINPRTFIVFGFRGQEAEIQNRTMDMVLDSKGTKSNVKLSPNTAQAINDSTQVNIRPRGMEESSRKPNNMEVSKVVQGGFFVKDLDSRVKLINKKGREGELELDITHFMR